VEGRNKELSKERDKLFKEVERVRRELEKARTKGETEKAKKDAEKGKKEAKKKQSDKGAISPTGVSKALEEKIAEKEQLYEDLRNEYDVSGLKSYKCM